MKKPKRSKMYSRKIDKQKNDRDHFLQFNREKVEHVWQGTQEKYPGEDCGVFLLDCLDLGGRQIAEGFHGSDEIEKSVTHFEGLGSRPTAMAGVTLKMMQKILAEIHPTFADKLHAPDYAFITCVVGMERMALAITLKPEFILNR